MIEETNSSSKHSSIDDSGSAAGDILPTKCVKTGKQYSCNQCSYSADKKVSINRHMRMHQTSPTISSVLSNGDDSSSLVIFIIFFVCLFLF